MHVLEVQKETGENMQPARAFEAQILEVWVKYVINSATGYSGRALIPQPFQQAKIFLPNYLLLVA